MSITLVQTKTGVGSAGSALNVTFDSPTTSGNFIEVTVCWRNGSPVTTFSASDNKSNTWQDASVPSAPATFSYCSQKSYSENITGGSSHQVTVTPNNANASWSVIIAEYSGVKVSGSLDQHLNLNDQFSANPSIGPTGTLASADELVTCSLMTDGRTATHGTGFTDVANTGSNGSGIGYDEYQNVSSTAAVTGSWTSTQGSWGSALATYQAQPISYQQEGFQFVNDNGNEAGSTFIGSQDTNVSWPAGTNIRQRVLINTSVTVGSAVFQLEFRKVGDSIWNIVTTYQLGQQIVFLSPSSNIAAGGGTATTARMTPPAGKTTANFTAGFITDDTDPVGSITFNPAGEYTEVEWCIVFNPSGVGNSYEFRVTNSGTALDTYSVTPQVTVTTPAAANLYKTHRVLLVSGGVAK